MRTATVRASGIKTEAAWQARNLMHIKEHGSVLGVAKDVEFIALHYPGK
jgi:hypothetical protein